MKYKNMSKNQVQLMVSLIQEYDPGLETFLDAVACLMEQTSGDKDKQLSAKQIAVNVAKLPLIAMKSKIMFAFMSDWENSTASTIQFLDDANESLNTNGYDQENVNEGVKQWEAESPEIVELEFNDEGLTDSMVASREFHAERESKPKK